MPSLPNYLFTSARLGFRPWEETDLPRLIAMNADPVVMEYFEDTMTAEESSAFFERMERSIKTPTLLLSGQKNWQLVILLGLFVYP